MNGINLIVSTFSLITHNICSICSFPCPGDCSHSIVCIVHVEIIFFDHFHSILPFIHLCFFVIYYSVALSCHESFSSFIILTYYICTFPWFMIMLYALLVLIVRHHNFQLFFSSNTRETLCLLVSRDQVPTTVVVLWFPFNYGISYANDFR